MNRDNSFSEYSLKRDCGTSRFIKTSVRETIQCGWALSSKCQFFHLSTMTELHTSRTNSFTLFLSFPLLGFRHLRRRFIYSQATIDPLLPTPHSYIPLWHHHTNVNQSVLAFFSKSFQSLNLFPEWQHFLGRETIFLNRLFCARMNNKFMEILFSEACIQ